MSYTLRPEPSGDTLVRSRDPIRTNFQVIQDRFNENHVGINGAAGGGKHKFLQMPEQNGAIPTATNEAALFARQSIVNPATTALFFKSESPGSEYQLTTANDADIATFGGAGVGHVGPNGWTFLPGGLIMMFGKTFDNANPFLTGTVSFTGIGGVGLFNFPNNIFQVIATSETVSGFFDPSRFVCVFNITTSGFSWRVSKAATVSQPFYWQALGN